ncbi:hypothetical protein B0H16DRAFT_1836919 [Mycena metata]|uniref:Uncharacterized protein n=1 Tax=Mycena metata TaxID=1033252 RepID=A0AAD7NAK3_9AGAR|nr:hypothetical protein B0H16DRAFT_1836919 [Mycena metata]
MANGAWSRLRDTAHRGFNTISSLVSHEMEVEGGRWLNSKWLNIFAAEEFYWSVESAQQRLYSGKCVRGHTGYKVCVPRPSLPPLPLTLHLDIARPPCPSPRSPPSGSSVIVYAAVHAHTAAPRTHADSTQSPSPDAPRLHPHPSNPPSFTLPSSFPALAYTVAPRLHRTSAPTVESSAGSTKLALRATLCVRVESPRSPRLYPHLPHLSLVFTLSLPPFPRRSPPWVECRPPGLALGNAAALCTCTSSPHAIPRLHPHLPRLSVGPRGTRPRTAASTGAGAMHVHVARDRAPTLVSFIRRSASPSSRNVRPLPSSSPPSIPFPSPSPYRTACPSLRHQTCAPGNAPVRVRAESPRTLQRSARVSRRLGFVQTRRACARRCRVVHPHLLLLPLPVPLLVSPSIPSPSQVHTTPHVTPYVDLEYNLFAELSVGFPLVKNQDGAQSSRETSLTWRGTWAWGLREIEGLVTARKQMKL